MVKKSPLEILKYFAKLLHPSYKTLFLEYPFLFKQRENINPHSFIFERINLLRDNYYKMAEQAVSYSRFLKDIPLFSSKTDKMSPSWNNGYINPLDILILYSMVAYNKPETYIEIGAGTSTKVVLKAKKEQNLQTKIISIDPNPRCSIEFPNINHIVKPLQEIDISIVQNLKPNDILFIDSSHRILPNSDMMILFLEVLPYLRSGVIVHFHDIYLPYDYPQELCDRFYSEQYGLAILLQENSKRYKILMPVYFISRDKIISGIFEHFYRECNIQQLQTDGGSFWIQIQ